MAAPIYQTKYESGLRAKIWKREYNGKPFVTVDLFRTYKKADGSYQDAMGFDLSQLIDIKTNIDSLIAKVKENGGTVRAPYVAKEVTSTSAAEEDSSVNF